MSIKVGIIGYGKMGQIRHRAIKEAGGGVLVAISEPMPEKKFETVPNISHDEIITHPAIDAIIICTPNYLNKDLTIRSLKAGKHVFCEKPPCFTSKEMEEIIEAEKQSGKVLSYGFNHRQHDSVIRMKELIDSEQFGRVLWMRGRYGKSVTKDFYKDWRAKKNLAGGGILMDQGIHMLDLFLYLGGDFDKIKAEVSSLYWKLEVEDNAFLILKNSETGMLAQLHSTMTQWRHLFSLEVFMEKGYMVLNGLITSTMTYGEETLSIAKNRSSAPAATWKDEVKTQYIDDNSWRYEIEHFINSVNNGAPVSNGSSADALKLMRIIDKVYEQKNF